MGSLKMGKKGVSGNPNGRPPADPMTRFMSKTVVIGGDNCWLWLGSPLASGYGHFWNGVKSVRAHRWIFEQLVSKIPRPLVLDHLCRNKMCVNPSHLEAVSQRENSLRGDSPPAKNAKKTHCKDGHELSGDNLYITKSGRSCRSCNNARNRAWRRRNKPKKDHF